VKNRPRREHRGEQSREMLPREGLQAAPREGRGSKKKTGAYDRARLDARGRAYPSSTSESCVCPDFRQWRRRQGTTPLREKPEEVGLFARPKSGTSRNTKGYSVGEDRNLRRREDDTRILPPPRKHFQVRGTLDRGRYR